MIYCAQRCISFYHYRHEIDSHGLYVECDSNEKDSFGYFKCRAACGYVYSTKATRNRYSNVVKTEQAVIVKYVC